MNKTISILQKRCIEEISDVKINTYKNWVLLLEWLDAKRDEGLSPAIQEICDLAIEKFSKSFEAEGSLPLEHTSSDLEREWSIKDYTKEQESMLIDILREAEKYSHAFMTLDDMMDYYEDNEKAQEIIKEEAEHLIKLFPTGGERYLVCEVTFDHCNNSIYTSYIYSFEAALGQILQTINNSIAGEAACFDLIRNDKYRYSFGLEADEADADEAEEEEEEGENDEEAQDD